jgi:hypothetical protein
VTDTEIHASLPADGSFARFRLAGGRFDSHQIPLEVLTDFSAYRRLVIEVAKVLYRKRTLNKVRVPKGFEESFQIGLASIEGGSSAVASMYAMNRVVTPDFQHALNFTIDEPTFNYPDFDEARAYIETVIGTVGSEGKVPEDFPSELAGFFNSFGQHLQEDEFIELSKSGKHPVRYDTAIRKTIVLSRETTYENAVDAIFILNGGDVAQGVIHVLSQDGTAFDYQPPTEFEFHKAYARASQTVRLLGSGLYDRNERLKRLLSISVVYNDGGATQAFEDRLSEISVMPAGWYDDENPAPSLAAIAGMRRFLEYVSLRPVPRPYLYPLVNGGISAEWSTDAWEASGETHESGSVVLHAINIDTQVEISAILDLGHPDFPTKFMAFMNNTISKTQATDADQ